MSVPRFAIGDRAMIVNAATHPHLNGEITTICSGPVPMGIANRPKYRILLAPSNGAEWYADEACLKPIYDGDEPAVWTDCVWQPKEARA